ncbi:MAG TPA: hypothetical protein VK191_08825 [Symbiobacteriaceae bacterium]|nr:hypothetical protein [Symbiobacteriaceae bacterium]
MAFRLGLLILVVGLWMAGSVAGAAAVTGRRPQLDRWALGGFLWGIGVALLLLIDCVQPWPGLSGRLANLLYLGGAAGGLVGLNWRSTPSLRWLWTALLGALTFLPFFVLSVLNALCHLS